MGGGTEGMMVRLHAVHGWRTNIMTSKREMETHVAKSCAQII